MTRVVVVAIIACAAPHRGPDPQPSKPAASYPPPKAVPDAPWKQKLPWDGMPGEIRGIVHDATSHSPIQGAQIVVTRQASPTQVTTRSNPDGTFEIEVPSGEFQITVSMPGFRDVQHEGVLDDGAVLVSNYDLRPLP